MAVCVWVGAAALAQNLGILDSLTVNGVTYEHVRWGPVNNGKVTIIHAHGAASLKLEDLPPGLQTPFPYTPKAQPDPPAPRPRPQPVNPRPKPSEPTEPVPMPEPVVLAVKTPEQIRHEADLKQYDLDRATKVLFGKKLVEKSKLTQLTGFVNQQDIEFTDDGVTTRGAIIELAEKKPDAPKLPAQFELRPGLWQRAGETVFLKDFVMNMEVGAIVRVFGSADGKVRTHAAYLVGVEPTFEQWQKARGAVPAPNPAALLPPTNSE